MSWVVTVLGADGLQYSETDLGIQPKVEVIGRGVALTLVGSTPASVFRHPTTQTPQWQASMRCDFFRCHTLEFVVYHYRPVGFNTQVGRARIPLQSVRPGEPTTIPIAMDFRCHHQPTLTFSAIPQWTPYSIIGPRLAHRRIFVFTTYSPPIEGPREHFPVSFKCVSVDKVEKRFSVFDETVDWTSLGKGCLGHLFPGPTGETYVAMLNRAKLRRSFATFILCSHNYSGHVTLNFVLAETNGQTGIYRKHPTNEALGLLNSILIPVTENSAKTIAFKLRTKRLSFSFEPIEPLTLSSSEAPSAFEDRVAHAISPTPCTRRLIQPRYRDRNICDMADICKIPNPSSINLLFGWVPLPDDPSDYDLSIAIQLYDSYGCLVRSISSFRIGFFGEKKPTDSRVITESSSAFAMHGLGLKSELFLDRFNVRVNIAQLFPDVCSLSFVAYSRDNEKPHEFKRKFVRIVEPQSKMELELFTYRMEDSNNTDAVLIGGLYFANDNWVFAPVVQTFACKEGFTKVNESAVPIWVSQLTNRGLLSERVMANEGVVPL
jgi:hypothetical protein